MSENELMQAILKMLQAELDAMHFYQQASHFISDNAAIYHFNLLAQEELEHARTFYAVYPGENLPEFDQLVRTLPNQSATLKAIAPQQLDRLDERTALQLAIKMEEDVANNLKMMLREVSSPAAKAAIEENIDSTLGHLELIQEDYNRLFASAEEP